MVTQPIPEVTGEDVDRLVHRDFPAAQTGDAFSILLEYGADCRHREPERVRAAALKLAAGDLERLRGAITTAKSDYRDVLALAEYPEYSRSVDPSVSIAPDERQRIIDDDWEQYRKWFSR